MLRSGLIANAGRRLFVRDPLGGVEPPPEPVIPIIEQLEWQRIASPVFLTNPSSSAWDHETTYYPVLARNLDRSPKLDENGRLMMYYTGDNTSGTDYDRGGLALGDDVDTWTRYGSTPLLGLGSSGQPDAGDAQITSMFWDGTEFISYYQGNATPPGDTSGDDVTVCLATSPDGKTPFTKLGRVISKGVGAAGDANDIYRPKLIPAGHDGKPKLYYTGKDMSNVFGLMGATSVGGSLKGPWTKLGTTHLLRHGTMFLEDAWYADGLYQFIYIIGGSTPGGLWYATSENGTSITVKKQILPQRPGFWDAAPTRGSYYVIGGTHYFFYDAGGASGIGYAYAS